MRRYKHNLSDYRLLTGDISYLYPVGLTEVLPNDTIQQATSALIRMSPMAAPVMHPITVRVHHFFVPHRLSWSFLNNNDCGKSWESFITGGADGNDATQVPQMTTTGNAKDVLDYMGIPRVSGISVSAVPVACYNLIWNEFYRDQDLGVERGNKDLNVATVAWEKDYFTASRPWPQKGPEVTLPVAGQAPVRGIGKTNQTFTGTNTTVFETGQTGSTTFASSQGIDQATGVTHLEEDPNNAGFPGVYADLSQASATNINDVRRAFALQRFQEARSRYGSRYTEYLRYLGVTPRDSRLDRPEYLGGGSVRVAISEVLQTAPEGASPRYGVGDMYGHGIAAVRHNPWRRFFDEHGYVVTMLSVRPKAIYGTPIHRTWLRQDKEDFYQRELEFIGQQAVYNNELYADATNGGNVFGYADRYREYRESPSLVTAEFRDTLNYWHLAREFSQAPALNEQFVYNPASKRIYNSQSTDGLWIMVQNRRVARRLLSKSAYGKII